MTTHVLRGSKQEIAERLVRISGEVREAIVFEEEAQALRVSQWLATRKTSSPKCSRTSQPAMPT